MLKIKNLFLTLLIIFCITITGYTADLYGTYDHRIKLTIDADDIDATLTWFPVTVYLTSTQGEEIFTEFDDDDDFNRIAFTTSDESTQLYADCEMFDYSEQKAVYYVSKTGWEIASDTDTDFYIYYDNDASPNATYISASGWTPARSVWDSNFKFVSHMRNVGQAVTMKFYQKGADVYSNDGEVFIFDSAFDWVKWDFSYTSDWQEITLDLTSPDGSSGTMNWEAVTAYRFDLNTTSRTIYIDNIRVYDADGLIHSNMCESITDWSAANGTRSLETTIIQEGSSSIKLVSTGADANAAYNPSGTWDWKNSTTIIDSTGSINGTKKAAGEPAIIAGYKGKGQNFDGSDDYVNLASGLIGASNNFSLEAFLKADTYNAGGEEGIVDLEYGGGTVTRIRLVTGKLDMSFGYSGGWVVATRPDAISTGTWYYTAGTYDNTDGKIYQDTDVTTTNNSGRTTYNSTVTRIGHYINTGDYEFDGILDEVRVSNTARSAAWTKASSETLHDTLLTYGSQEPVEGAGVNVLFIFSNF